MLLKLFSSLMVAAMFLFPTGSAAVLAQTAQNTPQQTEKIRAKVKKLGLGERVKVTVKLYNDASYKGYVSQANDDQFVMVDKTGTANTIVYSEVKSVGGHNLSTGAKIGIGIAIGAGAVLAVLGILIASLDD